MLTNASDAASLVSRQIKKCRQPGGKIDINRLAKLVARTYERYERERLRQSDVSRALRKEHDETLSASQKRFELTVEGSNDGIWDWDVENDALWFSNRCKGMLGYAPDRLIAGGVENWYGVVHEEDRKKARAFVEAHVAGQNPPPATLRFCHRSGSVLHLMCRVSPIRDADERVVRLVGVLTDITDLIAMQEALASARDTAEAASRAKSDFLANMSHEIRTPMNSIMGMTNLLLETTLDPQQRLWSEIIRNSSESMLDIINDILDLSKIESGKFDLENIPFDLFSVVEQATDTLLFKAQEKNLELLTRYGPDIPAFYIGDPVRVRQILINLVGNAIKFTASGYVAVSICAQRKGESTAQLTFAVEDTGIGIPRDKLTYIFEKFSQAEESTTRKFGGTGLGLAICKRLSEMMGGRIEVKSEFGKGSIFTVELVLPIDLAQARQEPATRPDLSSLRVLVVDDCEKSLAILKEYFLLAWGMDAEFCTGGREGLAAIQRAAKAGNPFRVALVDYHLEGMNGKAFIANAIRQGAPPLRFAALTSGESGNLKEMQEAGFCGVIGKPFTPSRLMNKLAMIALGDSDTFITRYSLQTRDADASAQENETYCPWLKILVVEDLLANQIYLKAVLTKRHCHIDVAENGRVAVEMMKRQSYDIIFMDCQMPEMDGYEATRAIRRLALPRQPFIVALTADAMQGDRERCLKSGMDEYLNKPVKADKIAQMLEKYARLSREDMPLKQSQG